MRTNAARGTNLRQLLVAVRALPFAEGFEVEPMRVRWPVATDVARFDEALELCRPTDVDETWARPLLDGFRLSGAPEFASWLELERGDRNERVRSNLYRAARRSLASDRALDAAELLDPWLVAQPLDEEAFRLWAEASSLAGRRTTVLARYESFAARIVHAFGVEPEVETTALVERIRSGAAAGEVGRSELDRLKVGAGARHRTSRAARLGRFFGREAEMTRLDEELVPGAVVAVVAAGGMGKTRLALEAVDRFGARFLDGVVHVELHEVRDEAQANMALARAIGLDPSAQGSWRATPAEALVDRRPLVVLDNVEQIEGFESVLERWRVSAPNATWLVTSRRTVEGPAVSTLELGGLPYPAEDHDGSVGAEFASIAMLVQRARHMGVVLDHEADRGPLARVARSTAGMPLALELAAGWLRVIPIRVVADEIAAGLDLLRSADERRDRRHASVRAMFDASWSVLTQTERAVLVDLASFRGGFTEAAARIVAHAGRPTLLALRNKSFVSLAANGRFFQHPLLETYVREHALLDPAFGAARSRHAQWVFEFLEEQEQRGQRGGAATALLAVADELPNVEAAWTYALEAGAGARFHVGGATMVNAFRHAGRIATYDELVRRVRSVASHGSAPWAWAHLSGWSSESDQFGRDAEAYAEAEFALATLRRSEHDPYWLAWAHYLFAHTAVRAGRRGAARAAIQDAAERYASIEDWDLVGEMRVTEYMLADGADDRHRLFAAVEALARRAENTDLSVRAKRMHARFVATTFGEWGTALRLVDDVIAIERRRSAPARRLVDPMLGAAGLATAIGDLDLAEKYAAAAQSLAATMGPGGSDQRAAARAALARIAWLRQDFAGAMALLDGAQEGRDAAWTEILRSEIAFAAGDTVGARLHAEHAAAGMVGVLDLRARTVDVVGLQSLRAKLALAADDRRNARALVSDAIERALVARLLPALLGALSAAAPLLPTVMHDELEVWCSTHPAAEFGVRRRRLVAGRDTEASASEHGWEASRARAERVLSVVRGGIEEVP
jgi:DNA-binding SARP family transcriptional activator